VSEQRGADTVFKPVALIGNAKVLVTGIEPHRELPPHCHETEVQFYFAIEGEGVVRIGDRKFPLRPGIAVTVAPGEVHGVRNPGDQMVRYIDILFGAGS
jgi:mannose-6-phosphate isomerase-like protein (cupin superfamily)